MQRRKLLVLGTTTAGLLALLGGTVVWLEPSRPGGRLSDDARQLLAAVAVVVLGTALPHDAPTREQALDDHLRRMQDTLSGLPPAMQSEVDQLLALLTHPAGRFALAGLNRSWADADAAEVAAALQGLRTSALPQRQQIYHALRDLTNAAYFAGPASWPALGYPGPRQVLASQA